MTGERERYADGAPHARALYSARLTGSINTIATIALAIDADHYHSVRGVLGTPEIGVLEG